MFFRRGFWTVAALGSPGSEEPQHGIALYVYFMLSVAQTYRHFVLPVRGAKDFQRTGSVVMIHNIHPRIKCLKIHLACNFCACLS